MKRIVKVVATIAVAVLLIQPSVRTDSPVFGFSALYVFGDSLSDTGNVWRLTKLAGFAPAIPPSDSPNRTYSQGRFSNGPILFEYLCARLQICDGPAVKPLLSDLRIPRAGAVSLAFGGSGSDWVTTTPGDFPVPGLLGQVELFRIGLAGRPAPQDALFTIFTGPNDYPVEPGRTTLAPSVVVGNIERAVRLLYAKGARNIVVVDLPDPRIYPVASLGLLPPAAVAQLVALATEHNQRLTAGLAALEQDLKKVRLVRVQSNAALQSILPQFPNPLPGTFFFPPVDPAVPVFTCLLSGNPGLCPDVPTFNGGGSMFWDAVHPTTEAHAAFADYIFEVLQQQF